MKRRKVLFTALYPYWSYHFTSELNLVEAELSAGSDVYLLGCDEQMQSCECNYQHEASICAQCIGVRKEGVRRLSGHVTVLPVIAGRYLKWSEPEFERPFGTVDELKSWRFDGFDAGMGAYSSLVDRAQSVSPDLVRYADVLTLLIQDGCRSFRSALDYLDLYKFDEVIIFNGRFSVSRAWVRACELRNVLFHTHERTGHPKRIIKHRNLFPHEPTQYAALVREHVAATRDDPHCRAEGERFYEERPKGKLSSWWSFVDKQTPGSLPEGFDSNRKNIAIFTSTDFEIAATSDVSIPRQEELGDQAEVILKLSQRILERDPDCMLYLRVHPNAESDERRWWEGEAFSQTPNLITIPPKAPLSSYALLMACDLTITWGSTMGVEATYWGKPSILLGAAFYMGIDAVYEPGTIDEAVDLIMDIPPPKNRENAVAFGSFSMMGGEDLPFSDEINFYELTFKGTGLWETTQPPAARTPANIEVPPVLFIVFNRPDTTAEVFKTIRAARPARLFVAADGPRPDRADDARLCSEVRCLIENGIDWDCTLTTLFRPENLGCKRAVSGAISWFFEQVEEGIVLEDDTVTSESFFPYCRQLLSRYRDDERVMAIGANNFQFGRRRGVATYYASRYGHVWGWASWRRAWKHYDVEISSLEAEWEGVVKDCKLTPQEGKHWKHAFECVKAGTVDTWDYQWQFAIFSRRGMALLPNVNLGTNIGFGPEASRTVDQSSALSRIHREEIRTINHLGKLRINDRADMFTFNHIYNQTPIPGLTLRERCENWLWKRSNK